MVAPPSPKGGRWTRRLASVPEFTHLDGKGNARMVDVSAKAPTDRRAEARCQVALGPEDLRRARSGADSHYFEAARTAGIMAAKRTPILIPLCHPLLLGETSVQVTAGAEGLEVSATVGTFGRTGVEMEALTACAAAALTLVHAYRHAEPKPVVSGLALWEKTGGRSGTWRRQPGAPPDDA